MSARTRLLLGLALVAVPAGLAAQSSQFGVRGLGIPIRPLSPRATATGGAFGMFDVESSVSPAAQAGILQFTALFTGAQSFRSSTNPFGTASGRDNRFPQILVAGPIGGTRLSAAVSISGYTDRSFSLGTRDSIDIAGERVGVFDTLSSRGGLTDFRGSLAWQVNGSLAIGVAAHAITGSNRVESHRAFGDTTYAVAVERVEISYLGFGMSAGITWRVVPRLTLAGVVRSDGRVTVDRDSVRIGETDLPLSVGGGLRWQPSLRTALAVSFLRRGWGSSDADIKAQDGIGANDTYVVSAGVEVLKDIRNPGHRPIRFGGHYATLPFPVVAGRQAHEFGLSVGTGFRVTGGRGGIDVALEQLWRSNGSGYTERATVVTLGISIRP